MQPGQPHAGREGSVCVGGLMSTVHMGPPYKRGELRDSTFAESLQGQGGPSRPALSQFRESPGSETK